MHIVYFSIMELAKKLVADIDPITVNAVLISSVGYNYLLHAINQNCFDITTVFLSCIADYITPDTHMANILRSEKNNVVGDDFLQFHTVLPYSHMLITPPLENAAAHLLHAIELAIPYGCDIRCIIAADTLRNRDTPDKERLYELLTNKYNASIEYADKTTGHTDKPLDVAMALIKVKIPEEQRSSIILDSLGITPIATGSDAPMKNRASRYDSIDNIVRDYENDVKAFINIIREVITASDYAQIAFNQPPIYQRCPINERIQYIRNRYWIKVYLGDSIENFYSYTHFPTITKHMFGLEKHEFNAYTIIEQYQPMVGCFVRDASNLIIEIFTQLSGVDDGNDTIKNANVNYYEGWCENKTAWKIKYDVKIPHQRRTWESLLCEGLYDDPPHEKLRTIEQTLNLLDGNMTTHIDIDQVLCYIKETGTTCNVALKYFLVSFLKEDYVLDFTEHQDIITKLNIHVGRMKNWLPPRYGKVAYEDLEPEERAVVDSFQGKDEYDYVVAHSAEYLVELSDLVQLPGHTKAAESDA